MVVSKKQGTIFLFLIVFVLLILGFFFFFSSKNSQSKSSEVEPKKKIEAVNLTKVFEVPVYTEWVEINELSRIGKKRTIKYIVIHETANTSIGSDAKNHSIYLRYNNDTTTSWHYTVDDKSIYHHIPDDEIAYHAGDKEGNQYGIGIELCVNKDGDFEKTLENGAKLVAYLLEAYELDLDDVHTHQDFSGKDCPHFLLAQNRFEEFKGKVQFYYSIVVKEKLDAFFTSSLKIRNFKNGND